MIERHSFPWKARTLVAQALGAVDPITKAVVPPVHMATTFVRDPDNQYRSGYAYGRPDNATARQAEAVIAALEGAHEAAAVRLRHGGGDRRRAGAAGAIAHRRLPGDVLGVPRIGWRTGAALRPSVDFVDTTDLDAVRAAVKPGTTELVYIETPGNPLWTITDIAAVAEIAHAAGAMLAVEFHGGDAGVHAAARARRRHRDAFGVEIPQRPFRRDRRRARGGARRARPGSASRRCAPSTAPFSGRSKLGCCCADCARSMCGCARRAASAALLASRLQAHPRCRRRRSIRACPSHPGHAVAARQMSGFGAMLSIRVKGGERAAHRDRRRGRALETGDLARRRRKPDRAPRPRSRARTRPARPTCCGCRSGSRTRTISIADLDQRVAARARGAVTGPATRVTGLRALT